VREETDALLTVKEVAAISEASYFLDAPSSGQWRPREHARAAFELEIMGCVSRSLNRFHLFLKSVTIVGVEILVLRDRASVRKGVPEWTANRGSFYGSRRHSGSGVPPP